MPSAQARVSPAKKKLEAAIASDEARLKEAVAELEMAMRRKVSVSPRVREAPYEALGVAFACGLVLGLVSVAFKP